jgi:hypothetical protein
LNTYSYPENDYNLSIPNSQVARAYRDVATLSTKLYGLKELITDSNISPTEYRSLYPLFVFDVSKQDEKLKLSSLDIKTRATFDENVPAGTLAYARTCLLAVSLMNACIKGSRNPKNTPNFRPPKEFQAKMKMLNNF